MGNNLHDISTFDIDGFWHSTDYKYAYHIFTKQQDNGYSLEVSIVNNQLVSDDITLVKVDDSIVSTFIETWSNGNRSYTFKDDGTYTFDTGKSGRGGAYFIVGDKQIALGDGISDFKVYTYKFEGGYNDNK